MRAGRVAGRPVSSEEGHRLSGPMEQAGLPVFVHPDEAQIDQQIALRLIAFLRREIELIPAWHAQAHEYRQQLARLERRLEVGPRPVPRSSC